MCVCVWVGLVLVCVLWFSVNVFVLFTYVPVEKFVLCERVCEYYVYVLLLSPRRLNHFNASTYLQLLYSNVYPVYVFLVLLLVCVHKPCSTGQ